VRRVECGPDDVREVVVRHVGDHEEVIVDGQSESVRLHQIAPGHFIVETDGIAQAAWQQFGNRTAEMMAKLRESQTAIMSADFTGDARDAAERAEASFRTRIETCQTNCSGALDSLKTQLRTSLESFKGEMDAQYGNLLSEMAEEYGKLSDGTTKLAAHYAEGDASIKFA